MQYIGTNRLSSSELQTALFEVASILNERPIGNKTDNPQKCSYLSPDDLVHQLDSGMTATMIKVDWIQSMR